MVLLVAIFYRFLCSINLYVKMTDRSFENNLKDYTDENYLDTDLKVWNNNQNKKIKRF